MRKGLFISGVVLLSSINFSSAQITFQKTYGGTGYETFLFGFQASDSSYIFGGWATSVDDGYLVKTASDGTTTWSKSYDIYAPDGFSCGVTTPGNGYILAGFSSFYPEALVMKNDSSGNAVWSKSYVEGYDFNAVAIEQAIDGGYALVANTDSDGFANSAAFLFKIDSSGNSLWCRSYSGNGNVAFNTVKPTADNGYITAGWSDIPGSGGRDILLVKTDSIGNLLWSKSYGGTDYDVGYGIYQASDQGYIIAGTTSSFGNLPGDAYIIKTDSSGNILWNKIYDIPNVAVVITSLGSTTDGGFVFTGITDTSGAPVDHNAFMAKIDSAGNLLWSYSYGGGQDDFSFFVQQTYDAGYIIAGGTKSFGAGSMDGFVVKTDSNGIDNCNASALPFIVNIPATQVANTTIIQLPFNLPEYNNTSTINSFGSATTICTGTGIETTAPYEHSLITISPNPCTNKFLIRFSHLINKGVIEIYDVIEKKIYTENISNASQKEIRLNNMYAGMYFVKVMDGERSYCRKLIVE